MNAQRQDAANQKNVDVLDQMGLFRPQDQANTQMPFMPQAPTIANPGEAGKVNYEHMDRYENGLNGRLNALMGTNAARQGLGSMPNADELASVREQALSNLQATGSSNDLMSMIAAKNQRAIGRKQMEALGSLAQNTKTYADTERAPTDMWANQMGSMYQNSENAANNRYAATLQAQGARYGTDATVANSMATHQRETEDSARNDARGRMLIGAQALPGLTRPAQMTGPTAQESFQQAALNSFRKGMAKPGANESELYTQLQSRLYPPQQATGNDWLMRGSNPSDPNNKTTGQNTVDHMNGVR
jgi:hypothetical protein